MLGENCIPSSPIMRMFINFSENKLCFRSRSTSHERDRGIYVSLYDSLGCPTVHFSMLISEIMPIHCSMLISQTMAELIEYCFAKKNRFWSTVSRWLWLLGNEEDVEYLKQERTAGQIKGVIYSSWTFYLRELNTKRVYKDLSLSSSVRFFLSLSLSPAWLWIEWHLPTRMRAYVMTNCQH